MMKLDYMKDLMLAVINMALEKYHFELISYVIMDNHFHFFIRTVADGPPISRIMQFIKSQYARRYNTLMNRCGPLWNERYGDTIIEEQKVPRDAFRYINSYIMNNPLRAKYVTDPRDYKYGCIHFYLDAGYQPPVKLTHHKYFLELGDTFEERTRKFLELDEMYRKRIVPESMF
jgi:REP element-mobilizing transposase RayT